MAQLTAFIQQRIRHVYRRAERATVVGGVVVVAAVVSILAFVGNPSSHKHVAPPSHEVSYSSQVVLRAGVEDAGVHTLRHSAATAWLDAGVHIKAVADLLGHSSISITGDVYGHTSDTAARSAVESLGERLGL